MPVTDYHAEFRKLHPEPFFSFPHIGPVGEISFKQLTPENFNHLSFLFEGDPSSFVDERFKTAEGARRYAADLEVYGAYMPKHGGRDWLFLISGRYAGILHLYDMSLETFAQTHKRAWIGIATNEKHRKQGWTSKAVNHFMETIFAYYAPIDFIHAMTLKENVVSQNFLLRCGFQRDNTERLSTKHCFYLLTRPCANVLPETHGA